MTSRPQSSSSWSFPDPGMSLVLGPSEPPLASTTIGSLVEERANTKGQGTAVVLPWQYMRLTFKDLADRSKIMAKALLRSGLKYGDCVGIMAGNCYQYIEVFLGAARIGCPCVVFNNTYSPQELKDVIARSDCKTVFIASKIGLKDLSVHHQVLLANSNNESQLRRLVYLGSGHQPKEGSRITTLSYSTFLNSGHVNDSTLAQAEGKVRPSDALNLQFTSGTTGNPKAAVLTHNNLINNARYVGNAMKLTENDVVCSPPPLFHCFGLVMGFLASFYYGSSIVFPADSFDPVRTVKAIVEEKATAILGVPTMYIAELDALEKTGHTITTIRTGLASGSPVAPSLMTRLRERMNVPGMLIAYGMTETSPVTFLTSLDDSDDRMFNTVGRVFPHTGAKVVDSQGRIVPCGVRGELCVSGFALQKGYYKDDAKTKEVMRQDKNGVVWMHTGDEGYLDKDGFGHITGRIKDLIIRGGENISPAEIESRLLSHPTIGESCVVGVEDEKYGEVVACFLKSTTGTGAAEKPSDQEIRAWVMEKLGRIKAPQHIFWLGEAGVGSELPRTGSGKYRKNLVRDVGNALLRKQRFAAAQAKI